jgi:hypothetical protein
VSAPAETTGLPFDFVVVFSMITPRYSYEYVIYETAVLFQTGHY